MPVVLLELVGVPDTTEYVAVVTLNRPEAKNALNKELSLELARILGELRSRDDIRVCIVIGSGQCFCAGVACTSAASIITLASSLDSLKVLHVQLLCISVL